MSKYPHFAEALRELGSTPNEIATRLGVSRSALYYYLRGETLPSVEKIKRFPTLDEALTRDIRGESSECQPAQIPA